MLTLPLTDHCQLKLEYSSFQLKRFLLNTCLNPGTRLQPNKVDPFVHVKAEPLQGNKVDPYISEIPGAVKSLSWSIEEDSKLSSDLIQNPKLCFVELYSLDPHKSNHPGKKYWKRYFNLDKHSTAAPNGTLFQTPNDKNHQQISIELQDNRNSLLFGYGVVFTVEIGDEGNTYYCRIDPVANIRSRSTEEK